MRKQKMMFAFFPKKQESYIKDTSDYVRFIENTSLPDNTITKLCLMFADSIPISNRKRGSSCLPTLSLYDFSL